MISKELSVVIDYTTWNSKPIPSSLNGKHGKCSFDLNEVLLHIGLATRHPEQSGISLNDYWALLRYKNCFEPSVDFKLNKKWIDIDSHQKTILSDDFGMGFASYFLNKEMQLMTMVDTKYFLKYLPSLSTFHTSKNGSSKTPDFILLDRFYNIHLLECKGTQSSLSKLNKQLEGGVDQKKNIKDPGGIVSEKLVTGVFIPQFDSKQDATFKIIDPEFALDFSKVTKEEIIYKSFQGQLAKELHIFGMVNLGNEIAVSKNLNEIKLDEIISAITLQGNTNLEQDYLNKDEIELVLRYDLSLLKEYNNKKGLSLLDFFKMIYSSKNEYLFVKSKSTERSTELKGMFGLSISVSTNNSRFK